MIYSKLIIRNCLNIFISLKEIFLRFFIFLKSLFGLNIKYYPGYILFTSSNKKIEMLDLLNKQLSKYNKSEKDKFVFVEIGSYLGESLNLFGREIHKKLKDNYLIISIDPFEEYANDHETSDSGIYKMSKNITKIHSYFNNNIMNSNFKNYHTHIKMKSDDAFLILKKDNIKVDFCYIDGNHYYNFFKNDFINFFSIIKDKKNYKGMICGDDYELSFDEVKEIFSLNDLETEKFLLDNISKDFVYYKNKENTKKGFHPGITLFFHESKINIKKHKSGFWFKEQ